MSVEMNISVAAIRLAHASACIIVIFWFTATDIDHYVRHTRQHNSTDLSVFSNHRSAPQHLQLYEMLEHNKSVLLFLIYL